MSPADPNVVHFVAVGNSERLSRGAFVVGTALIQILLHLVRTSSAPMPETETHPHHHSHQGWFHHDRLSWHHHRHYHIRHRSMTPDPNSVQQHLLKHIYFIDRIFNSNSARNSVNVVRNNFNCLRGKISRLTLKTNYYLSRNLTIRTVYLLCFAVSVHQFVVGILANGNNDIDLYDKAMFLLVL